MARTSRYALPSQNPSGAELAEQLRDMMLGKINVAGEVTLAAGTVTTKIYDFQITATTVAILTPRSAAAAAIVPWQDDSTKGVINLGHAAPGGDVAYFYTLIG